MRYVISMLIIILVSSCAMAQTKVEKPKGTIDTADYFVQNDPGNRWRLESRDIVKAKDPEGTSKHTIIMGKHGKAGNYEVFYITDKEIQLRYEVHQGGRIRRFQAIGPDRDNTTDGYVWLKRHLVPGGKGFLCRIVHDDFYYKKDKGKYVYDRSPTNTIYRSVNFAIIDWGPRNQTGFKLNKVVRITSEWQPEGKIIEQYDYANGIGLVNWRWLESTEFMKGKKPVKEVKSRRVIPASNKHVLIEDPGTRDKAPIIYLYDLTANKKGKRLETVRWENYWIKKKHGRIPGNVSMWYVVIRDLSKEKPLRKVTTTLDYNYYLNANKKGPTIADLPYIKTKSPKKK